MEPASYEDNLRERVDEELTSVAKDAVQTVAGEIPDSLREPHIDALNHLESVIAFALLVFERTDGALVSESAFSAAHGALTRIRDSIATSPEAAGSWADALLDSLHGFPVVRGQEEAQAIRDVAANFARSSSQRLNHLESQVGDAQNDLAIVQERIVEMKSELEQAGEERRAEADRVVAELRSAIDDERHRLEATTTEQAEVFRSSQQERAEEFGRQSADLRKQWSTFAEEQREQMAHSLDEVHRMEEDARNMVGVIGGYGTAGRYSQEVKDQKSAANVWRWITVGVVLGAAAVALWAARAESVDDPHFISKVLISLALGGLAAYAAKQSAAHREREESARALELDMAVFGPFIERFPQEKQVEARDKMFDLVFGRPLRRGRGDTGGPSLVEQLRALRAETGGEE